MKLSAFRLERYLIKYGYTAPYHLCPSSCESLELGDLLALEPEAREKLSTLWLGYTEPLGHPDLRQAVTSLYEDISADQVLVHAGGGEVIFNFMNVALDAGDHVVVHSPHYQSLSEVARGIGAEVTEWPAHVGGSWELDLAFLENALTSKTRVVVVNFPHIWVTGKRLERARVAQNDLMTPVPLWPVASFCQLKLSWIGTVTTQSTSSGETKALPSS